MSIVGIVLAADSGSGFSGPKYLAPVHGQPMLQQVIDDATGWPVDDVIVVLGAHAEAIIAATDFKGMTVVVDSEWEEGSASPLRAALDLASRDRSVRRCLVARGDQPGLDARTVEMLVDRASAVDADAVVPKYRYSVGWPVILDQSLWEPLLGGEGSVDVLDVVASHAMSIEEVWSEHLPPATYESFADLPSDRR